MSVESVKRSNSELTDRRPYRGYYIKSFQFKKFSSSVCQVLKRKFIMAYARYAKRAHKLVFLLKRSSPGYDKNIKTKKAPHLDMI